MVGRVVSSQDAVMSAVHNLASPETVLNTIPCLPFHLSNHALKVSIPSSLAYFDAFSFSIPPLIATPSSLTPFECFHDLLFILYPRWKCIWQDFVLRSNIFFSFSTLKLLQSLVLVEFQAFSMCLPYWNSAMDSRADTFVALTSSIVLGWSAVYIQVLKETSDST